MYGKLQPLTPHFSQAIREAWGDPRGVARSERRGAIREAWSDRRGVERSGRRGVIREAWSDPRGKEQSERRGAIREAWSVQSYTGPSVARRQLQSSCGFGTRYVWCIPFQGEARISGKNRLLTTSS